MGKAALFIWKTLQKGGGIGRRRAFPYVFPHNDHFGRTRGFPAEKPCFFHADKPGAPDSFGGADTGSFHN